MWKIFTKLYDLQEIFGLEDTHYLKVNFWIGASWAKVNNVNENLAKVSLKDTNMNKLIMKVDIRNSRPMSVKSAPA